MVNFQEDPEEYHGVWFYGSIIKIVSISVLFICVIIGIIIILN